MNEALFARATFTVKLVMIVLLIASFWAWAVIIQKLIDYRRVRRESQMFDMAFWSGEPLDDLYRNIGDTPRSPAERVFVSGCTGMDMASGRLADGIMAQTDQALRNIQAALAEAGASLDDVVRVLYVLPVHEDGLKRHGDGLVEVKKHEGMTIAQDPAEFRRKYKGLQQMARARGLAGPI